MSINIYKQGKFVKAHGEDIVNGITIADTSVLIDDDTAKPYRFIVPGISDFYAATKGFPEKDDELLWMQIVDSTHKSYSKYESTDGRWYLQYDGYVDDAFLGWCLYDKEEGTLICFNRSTELTTDKVHLTTYMYGHNREDIGNIQVVSHQVESALSPILYILGILAFSDIPIFETNNVSHDLNRSYKCQNPEDPILHWVWLSKDEKHSVRFNEDGTLCFYDTEGKELPVKEITGNAVPSLFRYGDTDLFTSNEGEPQSTINIWSYDGNYSYVGNALKSYPEEYFDVYYNINGGGYYIRRRKLDNSFTVDVYELLQKDGVWYLYQNWFESTLLGELKSTTPWGDYKVPAMNGYAAYTLTLTKLSNESSQLYH